MKAIGYDFYQQTVIRLEDDGEEATSVAEGAADLRLRASIRTWSQNSHSWSTASLICRLDSASPWQDNALARIAYKEKSSLGDISIKIFTIFGCN